MKSTTLWHYVIIAASGIAIAVSSCKDDEQQTVQNRSLYTRLGGTPGITAVIDTFITFVAADTVINAFFSGAVADTTGQRIARLKSMLISQICEATGGPCTYAGLPMSQAHHGMNVQDQHFDALVGDLVKALDAYSVPATERNELLAILGPLRSQIVGQRPG